MKACLDIDSLIESAKPQLTEMVTVGAAFTSPHSEGACEAFSRQVFMVQGSLKQTFRAATLIAKKAPELEGIAELWARMSLFCDSVLRTLASLKEKYPECGTPALYDLALDLKRACEDRLRDVEEEIECQKIDLPKGLLSELR